MTFLDVVDRAKRFTSGMEDLESFTTWIKSAQGDLDGSELPEIGKTLEGMRMRIAEYKRLVGWTRPNLDWHITKFIENQEDMVGGGGGREQDVT